jgi:predicted ATPase
MMGILLHYRGDQAEARAYIERVLARYVPPAHRSHTVRFQFDHRVLARVTLARILWLQGFPDQAMRTAQGSVDQARAIDHSMSLCNALAHAAYPIALFVGDLPAAERAVATLLDESGKYGLTLWQVRGRCLAAALQIKRGDALNGLRLIRAALDELSATGFILGYMEFPGFMIEGLVRTAQGPEALVAIDEALEQSEHSEERWCVAELLRTKGELLLMEGAGTAAVAAEDCFLQALAVARRQGALSWELRAATSLARLRRDQNRTRDALNLLAPVHNRFSEGFDTADLKAAKALIQNLQ